MQRHRSVLFIARPGLPATALTVPQVDALLTVPDVTDPLGVRDQTRIVDLKQVNRVLIQPHWRKDCDVLS